MVALVGDGFNAAPVLVPAEIGIAISTPVADPAIESSDITLMSGQLDRFEQVWSVRSSSAVSIAR